MTESEGKGYPILSIYLPARWGKPGYICRMRPHKNLIVWQESLHLVKNIYLLCASIPDSEKFGLISQLKRASVSVPANISEGAARNSKKEFIQFLYISSGSLSEVETLTTIAVELNYINAKEFDKIEKQMNKISALLQGLINKLKSDTSPKTT